MVIVWAFLCVLSPGLPAVRAQVLGLLKLDACPGMGRGRSMIGLGLVWDGVFMRFLVFCVGRPVRADGKARNMEWVGTGLICGFVYAMQWYLLVRFYDYELYIPEPLLFM